jgi:pre-mRNA-splicing factor 18
VHYTLHHCNYEHKSGATKGNICGQLNFRCKLSGRNRMDLLKKELERKKKALELAKQKSSENEETGDVSLNSGGKKYHFIKAGELRRLQELEEERMRFKRSRSSEMKDNASMSQIQLTESDSTFSSSKKRKDENINEVTSQSEAFKEKPMLGTNYSSEELLFQLRNLGLPIRLFGESMEHRVQRLQKALEQQNVQSKTQAEMDEFRLGKGHGIRNPFLNRGEDKLEELIKKKYNDDTGKTIEVGISPKTETETNDPHKKVYRYLKGLLNSWEDDLALRPEPVKRTAAGKNETKTLKQCKDYIRPLFKQLKTRKLDDGIMDHMIKIVDYCQEGEFVKAHDSYLDLAIGRSAWPIGVTMVGIHARSGRAKIEAANVAHVMNSELHRKYLTSVKRLMTYAQKKADHVDPSKKVLNM